MRRAKKDSLPYISRTLCNGDDAYLVSVYKKSKPYKRRYFTDKKYRSKKRAREAAIQYRDELLIELGREPLGDQKNANGLRTYQPETFSKHAGVTLQGNLDENGNETFLWVANWYEDDVLKNRGFAVLKYGYDKSYGMAVKHRYKMIGAQPPSELKAPPMPAKVKHSLKPKVWEHKYFDGTAHGLNVRIIRGRDGQIYGVNWAVTATVIKHSALRDADSLQKSFAIGTYGIKGAYKEALRTLCKLKGEPMPKRVTYPIAKDKEIKQWLKRYV